MENLLLSVLKFILIFSIPSLVLAFLYKRKWLSKKDIETAKTIERIEMGEYKSYQKTKESLILKPRSPMVYGPTGLLIASLLIIFMVAEQPDRLLSMIFVFFLFGGIQFISLYRWCPLIETNDREIKIKYPIKSHFQIIHLAKIRRIEIRRARLQSGFEYILTRIDKIKIVDVDDRSYTFSPMFYSPADLEKFLYHISQVLSKDKFIYR